MESTTRLTEPLRGLLVSLVSPVYLVAESPYIVGESLDTLASTNQQLREQNAALQQQILELAQVSQQYVALKSENDRMRELLGSQARLPYEVLVSELVGIVPDPATHQVVIDKGANANLQAGQAVLDANGLYGQIVEVGQFTSRVLLVTDANHAIPVQVNRNGLRSIAGGTGEADLLTLENVPVSADIAEGDLIETSGLGGRFPPGYPVGVVLSVVVEATSTYAQVEVRPTADLDRSRHLLVIFNPAADEALAADEPLSEEGS